MVSTRQVPWMTLGKLTEQPMTAAEAAKQGGLDFDVVKCDLFYASELVDTTTGEKQQVVRPIPHRRAIVRTDTGVCLGIMAKNYPPLQYREAFDFMDQVNPKFVAAGALRSGRQGFMVVETDLLDNVLGGEDPHKLYAVLRTSHDGTRAVEVTAMSLRGKCMNQLTMQTFTRGARYRWSIKHTSTMAAKLKEATQTLSRLGAYADAYRVNVDRLVHTQLHEMDARHMLKKAFPDKPKTQDQIDMIINSWLTAPTVGYAGTGWGLVNAVSEYMDWQRTGGNAESRFIGALQGVTHNAINRVARQMLVTAS
jgi:phage/plasmid-like protein (TIGR03299 family)